MSLNCPVEWSEVRCIVVWEGWRMQTEQRFYVEEKLR